MMQAARTGDLPTVGAPNGCWAGKAERLEEGGDGRLPEDGGEAGLDTEREEEPPAHSFVPGRDPRVRPTALWRAHHIALVCTVRLPCKSDPVTIFRTDSDAKQETLQSSTWKLQPSGRALQLLSIHYGTQSNCPGLLCMAYIGPMLFGRDNVDPARAHNLR